MGEVPPCFFFFEEEMFNIRKACLILQTFWYQVNPEVECGEYISG